MKKIFEKHREIIAYVFFGVITTAVSWAVHFAILALGEHLLGMNPESVEYNTVRVVAQVLQWIAGVLVAFFTNKKWVFNANDTTKKETAAELSKFAVGRLGTFGLDSVLYFGTLWILNAVGYNSFAVVITFTADVWAKTISSVVNIIANYVISKFFVFKKKQN